MVELCREFGRLLIFFFLIPKYYFHSQNGRNSCHSEWGEEKDSRAIELGQNFPGS